jgi:hypothetical protein
LKNFSSLSDPSLYFFPGNVMKYNLEKWFDLKWQQDWLEQQIYYGGCVEKHHIHFLSFFIPSFLFWGYLCSQ